MAATRHASLHGMDLKAYRHDMTMVTNLRLLSTSNHPFNSLSVPEADAASIQGIQVRAMHPT